MRTVAYDRRSRRLVGNFIVLLVSSIANQDLSYFTIQAPKRLMPRAVDRNRFKRLCRAVFSGVDLPPGKVVIVQPLRNKPEAAFIDMQRDIKKLVERV